MTLFLKIKISMIGSDRNLNFLKMIGSGKNYFMKCSERIGSDRGIFFLLNVRIGSDLKFYDRLIFDMSIYFIINNCGHK